METSTLSFNSVTVAQVSNNTPILLKVTTTDDQNDGSDENGLSLRDAILIANANPDKTYQIELTGGQTYSFSISGTSENAALTGDLDIVDGSNVVITASGQRPATINPNGDRAFHILQGGVLSLENVRITGARASGIINSGTLTVDNSVLEGNFAPSDGGGLNNFGEAHIKNSVVRDNSAGIDGGGIKSTGTLIIENSRIVNNRNGRGFQYGGGLFIARSATITGSEISRNSSKNGGGVFVENGASVDILDSSVSDNSGTRGGGIFVSRKGASVDLVNSLVSNNQVLVNGGGIHNRGTVTIENSTISGNKAAGDGGGIYSRFNIETQVLKATNSTITNNMSDSDNDGIGDGGGIYNGAGEVAELKNTILAGNFDSPNNETDSLSPDAFGSITGNGFNLVGSLAGTSGDLGTGSDIVDSNIRIGPLANNGGSVKSHKLLSGSPAINAGLNDNRPADSFDLDNDGNTTEPIPFDGRGPGFQRVQDQGVDIGAFEVQSSLGGLVINGTSGNDTLDGTRLNDTIRGNAGRDKIDSKAGNDNLKGGGNADTLFGRAGNDLIQGNGGNDIVNGSGGRDTLVGGSGSDLIVGGGGNDEMVGGRNDDTLRGGAGADSFLFVKPFRGSGVDRIMDFGVSDLLKLSRSAFNLTGAIRENIKSSEFEIVTTVMGARSSDALITYNRSNGSLYFNANGSESGFGSGGQFARLEGAFNLNVSDIQLIA